MKQFFKRFSLRLRWLWLQYQRSIHERPAPDLDGLNALVKLLYFVDLSKYRPGVTSVTALSICYPDMGVYARKVTQLTHLMLIGEVVREEVPGTNNHLQTTFDYWLMVSEGRYVNPNQGLADYRSALSAMLVLVLKHRSATVGVHAANRRLMRELYADLHTLTELVIQAGLS